MTKNIMFVCSYFNHDKLIDPCDINQLVNVDGTTIPFISRSIDDLQNNLNLDWLRLQDWLQKQTSFERCENTVAYHSLWSNHLWIEGQTHAKPSFSKGDQEIEMIINTKYLNVQVDSQLHWDKHVDTIKTKANRALGDITYSKKYLPSDVLIKM